MCKYVMVGAGLCLPVEDALGEEQVVKRALNLLPVFPDLKLYKEDSNSPGVYGQVDDFLRHKQKRYQMIVT